VSFTQSIRFIAEHVRARLARQISAQHTRDGAIPVLLLGARWDEAFSEAIVGLGDERQLAMAPDLVQRFIDTVARALDRWAERGEIPCLLTSPALRPFVRSVIERARPATVVLSQSEIHPRVRVRALGTLDDDSAKAAAA
jgi:flagellar biosynthesis protein FlhA